MGIKVLTVEDSTLIRLIINNTIREMDGVELIGTAENGAVAIEKIKELKPDIVTLDVVMPVMDGLETLKILRKFTDVPVIMLSGISDRRTTIEALENGAQDFLTKPESITRNKEEFKNDLEVRIKALSGKKIPKKRQTDLIKPKTIQLDKRERKSGQKKIDAIVIGASTGGPQMLTELVKTLPEDLAIPIFIVQHMPAGFTASFARRLDAHSDVNVVEAEDGMKIQKGTVYLAPGGLHMVINRNRIQLLDTPKVHSVRPAIDPMFESAIETYGKNILAVILTGMGKDGAEGCVAVKNAGGHVIAQDEESCVVYGMPKSAVETGAVDEVLSIYDIIVEINEQIEGYK